MLSLFLSFDGKINRKQFISGIIIYDIILMPLVYLAAQNFLFPTKDLNNIGVFFLVFFAMIVYGNFAIIFKRNNDAVPMNEWQKLFVKSPFIIFFLFSAYLIIGMITGLVFAQVWPLTLILGLLIATFFYGLFYIIILLFLPSS